MPATLQKQKPAPVEVPDEAAQKFTNEIEGTADTMLKACSKVRTRFSWFSTSAKIDDEVLADMMGQDAPQIVKDAITAQKRLLKSSDADLKGAKEAFAAVKNYVNSMSIPLLAVQSAEAVDGDMRKDGGVRLIQKKDMKEFDERMKYLLGILKTAVARLQSALPRIKKEDKERLDKVNVRLYKESDYPTDVTKLVHVEYSFEPIGVDADWAKLCPEIYQREAKAARKKFEAVVENAAVEFAGRFVKYVQQVVEQLGNRYRLNPESAHRNLEIVVDENTTKVVDVTEAEILIKLTHADEPDEVPDGYVLCQLRLKKFGKGRSTEVWMAKPMKENDFGIKLRPYETSERKKLYDSTIDNLKAELTAFANIGEMLGPYKDVVSAGVAKVKEMLAKGSPSLNTGQISEQLREGNYFRNEMKQVLATVAYKVQDQVTEAKEVRKKISKKLIGKV